MRIIIVSNIYPPEVLGGYEIECAQVADALHQRGHEILVLTSGKDKEGMDVKPYPVQRTLNLFVPFGTSISSAMRWHKWSTGRENKRVTCEAIAAFKPDMLFFWSPLRLGIGPARAAMEMEIPIVWRFGDESIAGFVQKGSFRSLREIYRYLCDHLLFPSSTLSGIPFTYSSTISITTKKRLIEQGLPLKDSQVIYKGIPVELFPLKTIFSSSLPLRLLYVGQLHPDKGVHTLIKACKKLHAQQIKVTLTIAGRGQMAYTNELKNLSQGDMPINFLGFVPFSDIPDLYQKHDILVFPSEWVEPQGTTFLEAMSSGVPVVATSLGGQGEILRDGVNAVIFEAGHVDDLCAALDRLINNQKLYSDLVKCGRECVEKHFSFGIFIDRLEELLFKAGT